MSDAQHGKVVWHVSMSVDGFIAGPEHAMDWIFEYDDAIPMADEVMTPRAILAGRDAYDVGEVGAAGDRRCYGGRGGTASRLTHEPPAEPSNPKLIFLSGDSASRRDRPRRRGGRNLEVFGATSTANASRPAWSTSSSSTSGRYCSATVCGSTASRPPTRPGSSWSRPTARARSPASGTGFGA